MKRENSKVAPCYWAQGCWRRVRPLAAPNPVMISASATGRLPDHVQQGANWHSQEASERERVPGFGQLYSSNLASLWLPITGQGARWFQHMPDATPASAHRLPPPHLPRHLPADSGGTAWSTPGEFQPPPWYEDAVRTKGLGRGRVFAYILRVSFESDPMGDFKRNNMKLASWRGALWTLVL